MKRKFLIGTMLLLLLAVGGSSQTNAVISLSVTTSPLNIVTTTACDHVVVRENSAAPNVAFIIQIGGATQTVTYPAGTTFTFVNQSGNVWPSGITIGNITAVTGSGTFVAIQSIGQPSTQN